jgi:hypothetical protein
MITWGGEWTVAEDAGSRYDPAVDHWTDTPIGPSSPPAREFHSAVWTGTQMIIWGGKPITESGGLYCACPNGHLVYRDADGDGYGAPGVTSGSCDGSLPAGFVENSADCNDGSAAIHPGSAETCNGIDDDCDGTIDEGIAAPSGRPPLMETRSGASAVLAWTAVAGATGYDVVKGSLASLQSSGGNFTTSATACLGNDLPGTTVTDTEMPAPGGGLWHLIRAVNACGGSGTYDEGSPSQIGSRDAEIQASGAACP